MNKKYITNTFTFTAGTSIFIKNLYKELYNLMVY